MDHGNSTAVRRVIAAFNGQTALGRALGCKQSVVSGWVQRGIIPSSRIPEIINAGARLDPPVLLEPADFFDLANEAA